MFAKYGVLNYRTYLVGAIFIVLVPGPSTIFVSKNSVGRRVKGDYLVVDGVFTGGVVLMFLAYAGVAALIETTSVLFNIARYLDAFYSLCLSAKILYATLEPKVNDAAPEEVLFGVIFKRALIPSLVNPKAILFYVSLFVWSIDVNAPYSGLSFFILTTTLEVVSFFCLSFLIFSGVFVTQYICTKKKPAKVGNSLIDLVFVGFAACLATFQL